jgi:hypothetical protein
VLRATGERSGLQLLRSRVAGRSVAPMSVLVAGSIGALPLLDDRETVAARRC